MDQNNNTNAVQSTSLAHILRVFKRKAKLLLIFTLIGAIIGGGLGVLVTNLEATYGAEIKFYITPGDNTQALLPILNSESFAEKLLLDENGLPPKAECNAADYEAALNAVKAEEAARAKKQELHVATTLHPYTMAEVESVYQSYVKEYERIYELLTIYKTTYSDTVANDPAHLEKIAEYEAILSEAARARKEYEETTYFPTVAEKLELDRLYAEAKRDWKLARENADALVEKVVSVWREDAQNIELVGDITDSVTFTYAKIIEDSKTDTKENQNSAFLIVNVAVEKDSELADTIVESIKDTVPLFVEKNVERITGTSEARCTLMSTFTGADDISESTIEKNIVTYAIAIAVIALVIASVCVILKATLPADLFEKKAKKAKGNKAE